MPKRHTYVATCIKETPIRWGVELASLGDPVPPKVVRFPHLTQSLTQSPYFQSGCDPIAYLRQLVKGMPEMLRGYNARIIKQIQGQMDGLQVGDCCYVKVSYIDNGEGISPYNYNIELIDTPPSESHYNFSGAANRENTGLPSAAPSMDNLYAPYAEEIDSDLGEFRASRSEEPLGPMSLLNLFNSDKYYVSRCSQDIARSADRIIRWHNSYVAIDPDQEKSLRRLYLRELGIMVRRSLRLIFYMLTHRKTGTAKKK